MLGDIQNQTEHGPEQHPPGDSALSHGLCRGYSEVLAASTIL